MYKPPRGNISNAMDYISTFINANPNSEFWILGDFNVDFLKRNVCTTKKAIECVCKLGLEQLIKSVNKRTGASFTCF